MRKEEVRTYSRRAFLGGLVTFASLGGTSIVTGGGFSLEDKSVILQDPSTPQVPRWEAPKPWAYEHRDVTINRNIRATKLWVPTIGIEGEDIFGLYSTENGTKFQNPPDERLYTLEDDNSFFKNQTWIYGHSSIKGIEQTFITLQEINIGDQLIINGRDRVTGEELIGLEYEVDRLSITDKVSGGGLLIASENRIPPKQPVVVLQSSARPSKDESYRFDKNGNPAWIFKPEVIFPKAENLVPGDLNDPSKYILMFAFASLTRAGVKSLVEREPSTA